MSAFDKVIAAKLRDEINTALETLAKKYGFEIRAGNCSYSETEIKYRLEVKSTDKEVLAQKEKKTWDTYCKYHGFEKSDLGKTFLSKGKVYKIVGLEVSRSKFNLKAQDADGKIMLFVDEQIAKKLHPETTIDKINNCLSNAMSEV